MDGGGASENFGGQTIQSRFACAQVYQKHLLFFGCKFNATTPVAYTVQCPQVYIFYAVGKKVEC